MQPLMMWIVALVLGLATIILAARRLILRAQSRDRVLEYSEPADAKAAEPEPSEERGVLGQWLALAGYRAPGAAGLFVGLTLGLFVAGLLAIWAVDRSGLLQQGLRALEGVPGAIGEIFLPILTVGPWIVLVIVTCIPLLVVRAARRRQVEAVEQDLPLVLELLATLGEAGLGFDAAIARIVAGQPADRPLTAELRTFRRETLAGRPRIEALRRLARRLDVPSLTIFISAVVQAEQVGAGVADVLRRQSEDARDRRRDRALTLAQALPTQLLFPLVICFLPAIFVVTLGPIIVQFIEYADAIIGQRTPR